jgi:hypothetical protein
MQPALEEWLAHPGRLLSKNEAGFIEHDGGDVPHRSRFHHVDEFGVHGLVANTVSDDIDARAHDRFGVVECSMWRSTASYAAAMSWPLRVEDVAPNDMRLNARRCGRRKPDSRSGLK